MDFGDITIKCLVCTGDFFKPSSQHICARECKPHQHVDICDTCQKLSMRSFDRQLERFRYIRVEDEGGD